MAAGALTETVAGVLAWTVRPCAELTAPLHATDYASQSHMRRLKVCLAPAEYPSMSLGERPWRSRMAIGLSMRSKVGATSVSAPILSQN